LGVFSPRGWDIKGVTAVMPMAVTLVSHALVPFVLNPSLMVFNLLIFIHGALPLLVDYRAYY
jgi:hypothetical protein